MPHDLATYLGAEHGTPVPHIWSAADLADNGLPARALNYFAFFDGVEEVDPASPRGLFTETSHHGRTTPKKGPVKSGKARRKSEKTAQRTSERQVRWWNEPLTEFDTLHAAIQTVYEQKPAKTPRAPDAEKIRRRKRRAIARARTNALRAQQKH